MLAPSAGRAGSAKIEHNRCDTRVACEKADTPATTDTGLVSLCPLAHMRSPTPETRDVSNNDEDRGAGSEEEDLTTAPTTEANTWTTRRNETEEDDNQEYEEKGHPTSETPECNGDPTPRSETCSTRRTATHFFLKGHVDPSCLSTAFGRVDPASFGRVGPSRFWEDCRSSRLSASRFSARTCVRGRPFARRPPLLRRWYETTPSTSKRFSAVLAVFRSHPASSASLLKLTSPSRPVSHLTRMMIAARRTLSIAPSPVARTASSQRAGPWRPQPPVPSGAGAPRAGRAPDRDAATPFTRRLPTPAA